MLSRRAPVLPLKKCDDPPPSKQTARQSVIRDHGGKIKPMRLLVIAATLLVLFHGASIVVGKLLFGAFVMLTKYDTTGELDRFVNHAFYQILDGLDTEGEVTCMNYGYKDLSPDAQTIEMDPADEPERHCLQMYHKIASAAGDLTGLNVLEVGSGRGGGASYAKRYLHPNTMTGLDFSPNAVEFCQEKHAKKVEGLKYVQGDAEHLPFGNDEFDLVINVESSHCYANFPNFVSEVHRVLKPGGHFSWVDLRSPGQVPLVEKDFAHAHFTELKTEDVTPNVVAAMSFSGEQKMQLINRRVPRFARHIFYSFAGVEGTHLYKQLSTRELVYTHKLLLKKKNED